MFEVRNYGNSRKIMYNGMAVEITKNSCIQTEDQDMAMRLSEFPYIDLVWPKKLKDQLKLKRQQLMKWASSLGIPDTFFDDKNSIIEKINEAMA